MQQKYINLPIKLESQHETEVKKNFKVFKILLFILSCDTYNFKIRFIMLGHPYVYYPEIQLSN